MGFEAGLALKNLWRRRTRTTATVCGIAVAFAAMITFVGLAQRLSDNFTEVLDRHRIDIVVTPASKRLLSGVFDESIGESLEAIAGVDRAVGVLADLTTMSEVEILGVPVQGWPADNPMYDDLDLRRGRRITPDDDRHVMLGSILADKLQLDVGSVVEMEAEPFEVVGIFDSGNSLENGVAITPLTTLQSVLDRDGKVNVFLISMAGSDIPDADAVETVCAAITRLSDGGRDETPLKAAPARRFVQSTRELGLVRASAWATSAVALLVGTIAMFNTMAMSVFERTGEFGILRAIGWKPRRVVRLVLIESILISTAGALVGGVAAVVLVIGLSRIPRTATLVDGRLPPEVFLQGFAVALVVGAAAGLLPAIRGANLRPTEALRHV